MNLSSLSEQFGKLIDVLEDTRRILEDMLDEEEEQRKDVDELWEQLEGGKEERDE